MTKITLCEKCMGGRTIFVKPPNWEEILKSRAPTRHSDYCVPCPACAGEGLTPGVTGEKELSYWRRGHGIFGEFEHYIQIKPKPKNWKGSGFDLWINGRKITRGRKYLPAVDLSAAIIQTLLPAEMRGVSVAYVEVSWLRRPG